MNGGEVPMMRTVTAPSDRFWPKVRAAGECWEWTGAILRGGYGYFSLSPRDHKSILAHRFAYEDMVGPIPTGLVLDHLCRNKACVNPTHLEPVPQRENVRRGRAAEVASARRRGQAQCLRGHEYAVTGVRVDKRGRRSCSECSRIRQRKAR